MVDEHPTTDFCEFSPEQLEQINEACERFERQCQSDGIPSIPEYLRRVPEELVRPLFQELLPLVEKYAKPDEELVELATLVRQFPQLADDVREALEEVQQESDVVPIGETAPQAPSNHRSGSRGLHIQCPHCSNHVEVLVDTPYEEITCKSCGSNFNLVHREEQTRLATPLKSIGRFELISRLGLGGFGTVWKARDTQLDRVVAVKIPRRGQLDEAEIELFFREARAAAQLQHPYIVPVHEVGRDQETIFIVSDLVRGVELSDWLTGHRPTIRESAELCAKVAGALHHAHQHGVVHRDLKPSNIMMDQENQPHLMDFGLAKRETGELTMTVDGQILGTPAYMSPEQARGHSRDTDCRTDIYSLGVMAFRMLTGELPFRGNAQMQVHQRLTEDAPDPRKLNRHIPRDLSTICLKCLERDIDRRYATAALVEKELQRFLDGVPILARPLSRPAQLLRWARRKPTLAATGALVSFMAVAGPLVAVKIETQRRRLESLVVENNDLIQRYADDNARQLSELTQATDRLAVWEGKANPWRLWPPKAAEPPQKTILQQVYRDRYQVIASRLAATKSTDPILTTWEIACGNVGLAILTDQMGDTAASINHLEHTTTALAKLRNEDPDNISYRLAQADVYQHLARLHVLTNSEKASEYLRLAAATYDELPTHDENTTVQVRQMEIALRRSVLSGFDSGQEELATASRLVEQMKDSWPDDPVDLYRFICTVLEAEPMLRRPNDVR